MDALGNPLVLGALRCLDGAVDVLEAPPQDGEGSDVEIFKHAHGMIMRAAQLLERAIEYGAEAPQ